VSEVTENMVGWKTLEMVVDGKPAAPVPYAVRVVPSIRVALTFDDGPSIERFRYLGRSTTGGYRGSTEKILDVLAAEKIAGAFFVLTSPDDFLWKHHKKAETEAGFGLMRRMVREGHLIAAHWGGTYRRQTVCHPARLRKPAYDHNGDGLVDRVTRTGNALESDLLQCVGRIRQAYAAEGKPEGYARYIRPPLWRYAQRGRDARVTYRALGLKMIFTDAKLYDGGYPWAGFTLDSWMVSGMREALATAHGDIVITMHDSNPHTARDFESVLVEIRACMAKLGYDEGQHWHFVASAAEMVDVFETKRSYLRLASGQ
jgi:peptidoglycan/xylan/chitin deacetylase (PgdA/CDA1 family)